MSCKTQMELLIASMRENVLPKLISRQRSAELKERGAVLLPWLDLALCFYLPLPQTSAPDRSASILLTEKLLEKIGMSAKEIFLSAVRHLAENTLLVPFEEILKHLSRNSDPAFDLPFAEDATLPVWFVSNQERSFGAAAILCENVRTRLHASLGESFCVLPSSVHEVLCLPCGGAYSVEHLSAMVREVNAHFVDPADRLADHIYLCRNGQFEIPAGAPDRLVAEK